MKGQRVLDIELAAAQNPNLRDRFWHNVSTSAGCWEWQRMTNRGGYGLFWVRVDGKQIYLLAHRVAFALLVGPIPPFLCVLHRCDNPRCVNPDHLFLGTMSDNMRDRTQKGRSASGEKNGRSKLTIALVSEMRRRHKSGESIRRLGRAFGIAHSTCWAIIRGAKWKEI